MPVALAVRESVEINLLQVKGFKIFLGPSLYAKSGDSGSGLLT